jgi:diketogulonate reductase-like aldo/keto reductase
VVTISKACNLDHVTENAAAADLKLTEEEITQIDDAFPLGPRPRHLPML